jgi:hypothetical protein
MAGGASANVAPATVLAHDPGAPASSRRKSPTSAWRRSTSSTRKMPTFLTQVYNSPGAAEAAAVEAAAVEAALSLDVLGELMRIHIPTMSGNIQDDYRWTNTSTFIALPWHDIMNPKRPYRQR